MDGWMAVFPDNFSNSKLDTIYNKANNYETVRMVNCILQMVRWDVWQPLNLIIEYDLSIVDVPVQPVAFQGIHIILPHAVVHFFV
jgi:hypothetical protein